MNKRFFSLVLAGSFSLSQVSFLSHGVEQVMGIQEQWVLEEVQGDFTISQGVILAYHGNGGDVVIPSAIDGQTVTTIGKEAFRENNTITSVQLPNTVTVIEAQAFHDCQNLKEISFSNNLRTIGDGAFYGCRRLTAVDLPWTLTSVGTMVFQECSALETVVLPASLEEIGKQMFMNCSSLKTISLPLGVKYIAPYAFRSCGQLEEISLPNSLIAVEQSAFQDCNQLVNVHYPQGESQRNQLYLYPLDNEPLLFATWHYGILEEGEIEEPRYSDSDYSDVIRATEVELLETEIRVGELLPLTTQVTPSNASYSTIQWTVDSEKAMIQDNVFVATEPGVYWVECILRNRLTGQPFFTTGDYISVQAAADEVPHNLDSSLRSPSGALLPTVAQKEPLNTLGQSSDNANRHNYITRANTENSHLVETSSGFSRIEALLQDGRIIIESYNTAFQLTDKASIEIELEDFVTFYEGESYYYFLYTAANPSESKEQEVLRVVKYDKYWNRISHCAISDINTIGGVVQGAMAEANGNLLIHTPHTMFATDSGTNHQANMRFTLDTASMTLVSQSSAVSNSAMGYVSNSYRQLVDVSQDGFVVTANHGDTYPRAVVAFAWEGNDISDTTPSLAEVYQIPGMLGSSTTGLRLGGIEVSKSSVLLAGASTPQTAIDIYRQSYNIFLTVTPRSNVATQTTEIKWITDYTGNTYASNPHLVEVNSDKYILMWNELTVGQTGSDVLCWTVLNGAGNQTSGIFRSSGTLSEVQPLVTRDGAIVWYSTNASTPVFYSLTTTITTLETYHGWEMTSERCIGITDVPETDPLTVPSQWAEAFVVEAEEMGLLVGLEELKKNYHGNITRAQFCKLLMNSYEKSGRTSLIGDINPFTDTDDPAVLAAYALGIVNGTSPTKFQPNWLITRQELAVMVRSTASLFTEITGLSSELSFLDGDEVDAWAAESVNYAQQAGFLAGNKGNILPQDYLSVQEAIIVVLRLTESFSL